MTAAAHATLADLLACEGKAELIDGAISRTSPASGRHGFIETNLLALLSLHTQRRGLGRCFSGDTGFLVPQAPDTVLCPDASFVSHQRLPVLPEHGFPAVVPELVAEVVSPSDAWSDVEAKVQRWLSLGALLV